ncbi:MAG: diol dehydratase small subunit [Propionibacterium sp.]|nr:diol dehydratase small subunit [Propionibacterium sp.]
MDQEQLIRQIMAEVMKDLGKQEVTFAKQAPTGSGNANGNRITREQYPLAEKHPEMVKTASGRTLNDLTYAKVRDGELDASEFRITQETLELQAQVAEDVGRAPLARNLRRAAELVPVPDERLLEIYDALRPYRSTKQELVVIADELESEYDASISAGFIREAAEVYEARGRLRQD